MNTEFTVTEINEYARRLLASDPILKRVSISGEITGYKHHYSGHRYFALKDAHAKLPCVMYRQNAFNLDFEPKDGQEVVATGSISLYEATGAYQLYVTSIRKKGVGDLYEQMEQLKARLNAEGLFDPARKQEIPLMPRTIGLVTSKTGAAVQDMIRVARRRNPNIGIIIAHCAVQGEGAAADIARAIRRIDCMGECDVLLVGRGGGSIEDLWAFNEEIVARAIADCETPVISCVGHEIDFTIADYVADLRAATPSAAAELAVPLLSEKQADLNALTQRLQHALSNGQSLRRAALDRLASTPSLKDPQKTLMAPFVRRLENSTSKLAGLMSLTLERKRHRLQRTEALLRGIDPSNVVKRGYALVRDAQNRVITHAHEAEPGKNICIIMRDGSIAAQVTGIEENKNDEEKTDL